MTNSGPVTLTAKVAGQNSEGLNSKASQIGRWCAWCTRFATFMQVSGELQDSGMQRDPGGARWFHRGPGIGSGLKSGPSPKS
jgi:hypothetical protein